MTTTVFISYAREDSQPAAFVSDGLRRAGFTVLRDQDFLRAGQFGEQLDAAIAKTDVFLLLIYRAAVQSPWVVRELHVAADEHLRPILPVVLEETDIAPFRLAIAGLQRVDFTLGAAHQLADVIDGVYRSAALGRKRGRTGERRTLKVIGTILATIGVAAVIGGFGFFFFVLFAGAWNSSPGSGPPADIPLAFGIIFVGMVVAAVGGGIRRSAQRRT